MVLPTVSEFYTWMTVSSNKLSVRSFISSVLQSVVGVIQVLHPDSDGMFLSQDSGLSNSLSDQNITLLVPSSAAVAKMSSEDRSFWTLKGNVPSLIRFHLVLCLFGF